MHFFRLSSILVKEQYTFPSTISYLIHLFNGICYYLVIYNFACISTLSGALGSLGLLSQYIMFKQVNELLVNPKAISTAKKLNFNEFRVKFTEIFQYTTEQDSWLSKSFTIFFVVNFPLNAYLNIFVYTKKDQLDLVTKCIVLCLSVAQLICILGFHLVLSYFSRLIHASAKPLLSFMSQSTSLVRGIREQVQMANWIELMHTKKRLGKTYGLGLGLITMTTFAKVCKEQKGGANLKIVFS